MAVFPVSPSTGRKSVSAKSFPIISSGDFPNVFAMPEVITIVFGSVESSVPESVLMFSNRRNVAEEPRVSRSSVISPNFPCPRTRTAGMVAVTPGRFRMVSMDSWLMIAPFVWSSEISSVASASDVVMRWRRVSCNPYPSDTRKRIAAMPIDMPRIVRSVRMVRARNMRRDSLSMSEKCIWGE